MFVVKLKRVYTRRAYVKYKLNLTALQFVEQLNQGILFYYIPIFNSIIMNYEMLSLYAVFKDFVSL